MTKKTLKKFYFLIVEYSLNYLVPINVIFAKNLKQKLRFFITMVSQFYGLYFRAAHA